jgi:hypothetical protein
MKKQRGSVHTHETVILLHELDLGQHTLLLMSDGSSDLVANDEHTPYLADNGLSFDRDETYRLFIALHEQFQQSGNTPRKGGDSPCT